MLVLMSTFERISASRKACSKSEGFGDLGKIAEKSQTYSNGCQQYAQYLSDNVWFRREHAALPDPPHTVAVTRGKLHGLRSHDSGR